MTLKKYQKERLKARLTGAHIRVNAFRKPKKDMRKQTVSKYRHVFQMMLLGYKYCEISGRTGITESHLSMIVSRYAPHLLRGMGNHGKSVKTVWSREEKQDVKEKVWNPKSCKYI